MSVKIFLYDIIENVPQIKNAKDSDSSTHSYIIYIRGCVSVHACENIFFYYFQLNLVFGIF